MDKALSLGSTWKSKWKLVSGIGTVHYAATSTFNWLINKVDCCDMGRFQRMYEEIQTDRKCTTFRLRSDCWQIKFFLKSTFFSKYPYGMWFCSHLATLLTKLVSQLDIAMSECRPAQCAVCDVTSLFDIRPET